ncbi:MAG: FtsX-like permease family protein [Clostridium sp.]
MGLIKFAWLIVKRNLKGFLFYLATISITLSLLFVVTTFIFSDKGTALSSSTTEPFMALLAMIGALIFINFANSYFIKARTKEMGIIAISGRSVFEIGGIIFIENLIIVIASTLIGGGLALLALPSILKVLYEYMGVTFTTINTTEVMIFLGFMIYIIFTEIFILNLGYFVRKETREVIIENKDYDRHKVDKVDVKVIAGFVIFLAPIFSLLMPVPYEEIGQYASMFSIISIVGGWYLVRNTIPFMLNKIKNTLFRRNKNTYIAISNVENKLHRMGNLVIVLVSITIILLNLNTFSEGGRAVEAQTILIYIINQLTIGMGIVYIIISDCMGKVKSYKQLILQGYLKKDVKKVVFRELLITFLVIIILNVIPNYITLLPNVICGRFGMTLGGVIGLGTILVPIVLFVITYVFNRNYVMKNLGGMK